LDCYVPLNQFSRLASATSRTLVMTAQVTERKTSLIFHLRFCA
jgi:hypothetical protein